MEPITGAAILGGAQALGGIFQNIFSGKKKAERNLERHLDSYQPNQSIMDYYSKAFNRYNQNAYNSAGYRMQAQNADRNMAAGVNALQDRRSALAGIGGLVSANNDAKQRAVATAENQQAQNLAQLGQATGMKAAEDKYKFEGKYNLLAAKAAGANAQKAAGWQNIFGGLGSASMALSGGNGDDGVSGTSDSDVYNSGGRANVPLRTSRSSGTIIPRIR